MASTSTSKLAKPRSAPQRVQQAPNNQEEEYVCYVDGSWSENGAARIGIYLTKQGCGIKWVCKSVRALGPGQAEARGVMEAYKFMQNLQCDHGVVYSDSIETVDSLSQRDPRIHDWRSYDHIWSTWMIQSLAEGRYRVEYRCREDQGMQIAHYLANQGRIEGCEREGNGVPVTSLAEELDS